MRVVTESISLISQLRTQILRSRTQPIVNQGDNTSATPDSIEFMTMPNQSPIPAIALGVDGPQATSTQPPQEEIVDHPETLNIPRTDSVADQEPPAIPYGVAIPPIAVGESLNIQNYNREVRDLRRSVLTLALLLTSFGIIFLLYIIYNLVNKPEIITITTPTNTTNSNP